MPIGINEEKEVIQRISDAILSTKEVRAQTPAGFFAALVRQALDEVVDGPRTGRWDIEQLDDTEKTYVGTKVEIIIRSALGVSRGRIADCLIQGVETDIKWSKAVAKWMIGPENVGELCFGVCSDAKGQNVSAGLFVPRPERLTGGDGNRDEKRSLLAAARDNDVVWLFRNQPLQQNFIAALDPSLRKHVFDADTAQERVRRLAAGLPLEFIPRSAFQTVTMKPDGDPIRRLRQDRHNSDGLRGLRLLSTKQKADEIRALLRLGANFSLPPNSWLSVPDASL